MRALSPHRLSLVFAATLGATAACNLYQGTECGTYPTPVPGTYSGTVLTDHAIEDVTVTISDNLLTFTWTDEAGTHSKDYAADENSPPFSTQRSVRGVGQDPGQPQCSPPPEGEPGTPDSSEQLARGAVRHRK